MTETEHDPVHFQCPGCSVPMAPWEFEYREICAACKHYEVTGSWSIEQAIELGDFKPKALAGAMELPAIPVGNGLGD